MDAGTLSIAMGNMLSPAKYAEMVGPMNAAMIAADVTNVNRAAMWCAQLGHESGGLLWMQELASGAEYNNRADLGNGPKDGPIFKGRGPIQLTGRFNYGKFSDWCYAKGYVGEPHYFVNHPELVAQPRWGFLAASYYWTVARTTLNAASDRGDVVTATRLINGGTNGLADRQARWTRARILGSRLLPTPQEVPDLDANQANQLANANTVINGIAGKYYALDKDLRSDLADKKVALANQGVLLTQILAAQVETNRLLSALVKQ